MKTQVSSVDLHFLMREFQQLTGGRVDRIYHPKKEELLIQLYLKAKGKAILRVISGKCVFLTSSREGAEEPTGFCMSLRKHLDNSTLKEISQVGSERIIRMVFE